MMVGMDTVHIGLRPRSGQTMVAVGFSPRICAHWNLPRRVATFENPYLCPAPKSQRDLVSKRR